MDEEEDDDEYEDEDGDDEEEDEVEDEDEDEDGDDDENDDVSWQEKTTPLPYDRFRRDVYNLAYHISHSSDWEMAMATTETHPRYGGGSKNSNRKMSSSL